MGGHTPSYRPLWLPRIGYPGFSPTPEFDMSSKLVKSVRITGKVCSRRLHTPAPVLSRAQGIALGMCVRSNRPPGAPLFTALQHGHVMLGCLATSCKAGVPPRAIPSDTVTYRSTPSSPLLALRSPLSGHAHCQGHGAGQPAQQPLTVPGRTAVLHALVPGAPQVGRKGED